VAPIAGVGVVRSPRHDVCDPGTDLVVTPRTAVGLDRVGAGDRADDVVVATPLVAAFVGFASRPAFVCDSPPIVSRHGSYV